MIRLLLLWGLVFGTMLYAWVDWFRATLVLILLMAVYQHPDMPTGFGGIQGLNPWNLLLFGVLLAWVCTRRNDDQPWDLPGHVTVLFGMYVAFLIVSSARAILDPDTLSNTRNIFDTQGQLVGEVLINTFKWLALPILLFDGCRDGKRLKEALGCVLLVYLLIASQVAKYMPPQYAMDGDALAYRAIRVLEHGVGYHRVNLSVMLAGASWAIIASRAVAPTLRLRTLAPMAALLCVYAQMMTAGRAGYGTWALIGLTLCLLKWRRYLLAVPVVIAIVVVLAPGVSQRMLAGFTADSKDSNALVDSANNEVYDTRNSESSGPDAYTITAGRTFIWPFVIEKIKHEPLIGYGRLAMNRTRLTQEIWEKYREGFPHPHNAYLELLFDGGVVGALCVLPFYGVLVVQCIAMFRDRRSPTAAAVGGACLAVVLSLLYGAVGSQTFYPREGWVGMWCLIGLQWRVHLQRSKVQAVAADAAPERPRIVIPTRLGAAAVAAVRPEAPSFDDLLWPSRAVVTVQSPPSRLTGRQPVRPRMAAGERR